MTPHIPEEFSTRLIDWSPLVIMSNTMPPRDPDEDEEDEEEEDSADEPPVVREPDEDKNIMLAEAVRNTLDENKRLQQPKRVKAPRLGRWPYWPFSWPMADGPTL